MWQRYRSERVRYAAVASRCGNRRGSASPRLPAGAIHLDPAIVPGPLTVDLLDRHAERPARRHVANGIRCARADVPLRKMVHDVEGAAVHDGRSSLDDEVWKQRATVVFLRLERQGDGRIAAEPRGPLLVEERGEDQVLAVEAGPAEVDVRLAASVHRHDVRPESLGEERTDAVDDRNHSGILDRMPPGALRP